MLWWFTYTQVCTVVPVVWREGPRDTSSVSEEAEVAQNFEREICSLTLIGRCVNVCCISYISCFFDITVSLSMHHPTK